MTHWPDIINAAFEGAGGLFIWQSVVKLHAEKLVRGVSWKPVCFFSVWGYWNLFYYPHLDQWLSFAGGCGITLTNSIWAAQIIYYRHLEKQRKEGPHDAAS